MDYEVMRLAKQAMLYVEPLKPEALARFAELVAAQEREACAKICEFGITVKHPIVEDVDIHQYGRSPQLAAAIRSRTFGD